MRTKKALSAGLLAVSWLAACGGPEPGSQEALRAEIESLDLPRNMVELDHTYNASCPPPCPSLVVWYEVVGSLEQMRTELVSAVTAAGWDVNDAGASMGLYNARSEDHLLFLVIDPPKIADNPYAPPGAKIEIVVIDVTDSG